MIASLRVSDSPGREMPETPDTKNRAPAVTLKQAVPSIRPFCGAASGRS